MYASSSSSSSSSSSQSFNRETGQVDGRTPDKVAALRPGLAEQTVEQVSAGQGRTGQGN